MCLLRIRIAKAPLNVLVPSEEVSIMDLQSTMMNQPVTRSREMGGEGDFHLCLEWFMNQIKAVIAPLHPGKELVSGVADKWIYIVISIEIDKGAEKRNGTFWF